MRRNLCLLLLVLALPASAADRAEEVRATEIAFAKAFADRDAKKFFLYLADDAQFLGRRNTMHGKQEVIAGWFRILQIISRTFPLAALARRNKRRWRLGILHRSRFR